MITKENFKDLLQILGFKPASQSQPHILVKNFKTTNTQQETSLKVDLKTKKSTISRLMKTSKRVSIQAKKSQAQAL